MHIVLGAYLLSGTPGYRQAGIHQYIRALLEALGAGERERGSRGARAREQGSASAGAGEWGSKGEMLFTALISPTAQAEVPLSTAHSPFPILLASRSTETPLGRIRVEQLETPPLLQQLRANVYHGMAFVAPLRTPCPTVITVHDLSFLTRPETHKLVNRLYLSLFTRWSCRRAARVIAVSEWTKRDVVSLLGVDAARVDVIPHGVHSRFKPLPPDEVTAFRRAHNLSDNAIFFLGSLEPRKNLPTLIEALAVLSTQYRAPSPDNLELIVGGSPGWKYQPIFERIEALGLKEQVRFIGQVAQEELPMWYNACAVFAYPSLYEGFGMPVLEAMACGAPVITSNVTSLPEVVGDAAIMVAPTDTPALAAALARVLENTMLQQHMRAASLRRAAGFTWAHTAALTMDTYRRAAMRS